MITRNGYNPAIINLAGLYPLSILQGEKVYGTFRD